MKKIIALALCALMLTGSAAFAEMTVTAIGQGETRVAPDCASISMGVAQVGADVVAAQQLVNEQIAAVREAVLAMGVKQADISVDGINMYEQYGYDDSANAPKTYNVSHQINVTVRDTAQVGAVIDAALAAGANQLYGVNFAVEDDKAAYRAALKAAVENARERAQTMAEAAGLTVGDVVSITENNEGFGAVYAKAMAEDNAAAGTVVDAGLNTVQASAVVVFQLIAP